MEIRPSVDGTDSRGTLATIIDMKNILILIFTVSFLTVSGQKKFDYEKEIGNKKEYNFQEIEFENTTDQITLSGTLITPKTEFTKIVIIVPGSSLDTRYSHYLLAQELLKNSVAVFRYDERGTGESEGRNKNYLYGVIDITNDLMAAIDTLKEKDNLKDKSFGLIGHSQGGMATIGAVQQGAKIDFLVQWATPVQKHGEFFKYQIKTGVNTFDHELKYDNIEKKIEIISVVQKVVAQNLSLDNWDLSKKINKVARKHDYKRRNYDRFRFWTFQNMKDILRQNYEPTYHNTKIPLLYIIGSKDKFVDPIANTNLLQSFHNELIEIQIINGLNHYLTNKEVVPSEIEMSATFYQMDKKALNKIIEFITKK